MDADRRRRVLRQHLQTDALLGASCVPTGTRRRGARGGAGPWAQGGEQVGEMPAPPGAREVGLDRAARLAMLERIDAADVRRCTRCPLCQGRTHTVFGEGDPEARIMFIGEGPGQHEDEQGRPFVGRAGELLNRMIAAMGLARERVYITNVVKCRPPNNRTPTPLEVAACNAYLTEQIRVIRPEAIVALGGPAAKHVLGTTEGITKVRGQWGHYAGLAPDGPRIPVLPTFHPAYLLRSYTEENRRRVWSDLQQVMRRLGLP